MKSVVGLVLGIIGSLWNLFMALFFGGLFIIVLLVNDVVASGSTLYSFISSLGIWSVFLSLWLFIFAILGFIFSSYINRDETVGKGASGCLLFGFLTLNVFLLIAGLMGFLANRQ